ncbi:discoidin domain-containing protein [Rubritalea tangerina]|uniref:Discoidin domain-containing protein n=1 Tax=Rubritalea tangerina TaxID=430798 RepID=A0ABW4Z9F4_9BACT
MKVFTIFLTIATCCLTQAATIRSKNFVEAAKKAKELDAPIAVFVHGASWHPVSERFRDKLWNHASLFKSIKHDLVLTEVHVEQQLDKEEQKKRGELTKGWQAKPIKSYPAIQLYSSDGQLLKTYQGQSFRNLATPSTLQNHLAHLLQLEQSWQSLWLQAREAEKSQNTPAQIDALGALLALPIHRDKKAFETLKKIDPSDQAGHIAKAQFNGWEFIRKITGLVNDKKRDEAHQLVQKHLSNPHFTPAQLAFILGAQGRLQVAENAYEDAYQTYLKAYALDPRNPDNKSLLSYGERAAGQPARLVLPSRSKLRARSFGTNISKDHATASASSGSEDNIDKLFKGRAPGDGHAFHTDKEQNPSLIINLHGPCLVNALYIENRRRHEARARGLTLWVSDDAQNWQKVWQAEDTPSHWDISLAGIERSGHKARFLKLSLEDSSPNYFHLTRIDIFGKRY